jgi:hypothetical protein
MGHVDVRATIANLADSNLAAEVDAMVDTGAAFTGDNVATAGQLKDAEAYLL